ncbi:MAG: carbohydrate ABC transporter substrate-binding protein, partial [Nitratireductor sp.]|nr:carbohydrate ABC transporter substrate-binding protein [Nitratireductor sp.]
MRKILMAGVAAIALGASLAAANAADLKFKPGEDARFNWKSYEEFAAAHKMDGQELSIFGPWRGDDQALVESVLAYFTEATGIKVNYASSENYEQQIVIDVEGGSPPNIAVLPQPGLIGDLASKGFLTPLGDETRDWLNENYAAGSSWVGLGTYKGKDGAPALYAFPYKIDVKSLVWYVPENFADAGYEVPQSMEDLKALTEKIVA